MENLLEEFLALWKKEEDDEEEEEAPEQELDDFWKEKVELWEQEENSEQSTSEENSEQSTSEEKRRAGWKPAEMDLLMDISVLLTEKKMDELEELYAKKLALRETEQEGRHAKLMAHFSKKEGVDQELMVQFCKCFPEYFRYRVDWSQKNPNLVFEDITNILAMRYTNDGVPRYVYENPTNSLQIYSVKVAGIETRGLEWPLHVFGVVAVRDPVDPKRNLIFNRHRDYCQTITKEDPYLVLTGPTRAVVMNEELKPVIIEAELKVKGTVESEDKYLIVAAETVPSNSGSLELAGKHSKLVATLGEIVSSVEATIFIRVTDGTWPAGFHCQFCACTASNTHKKVILIEFRGDAMHASAVNGDGNMEHSRHVVSVEDSGELVVSFKAWKGTEEAMRGEVVFRAEKMGRSFGILKVGSCSLGVLVAWSRIQPMREESV
ncbi:unnamed protein product [Urochloa humidicola]